MSDKTYPYDPNLPYVVVDADGDVMAKLHDYPIALIVSGRYIFGRVIDTAPKPRVPEDAQYLTWTDQHGERYFAETHDHPWEWSGRSFKLEDLPGVTPETVFTVLEERKS